MFVETKREGEGDNGLDRAPKPDLGTLMVDRILMLADEIEKPTLGMEFEMCTWPENGPACGTAACIGGHAEYMFLGMFYYDEDRAATALGLDKQRAWNLFFPNDNGAFFSTDRSRAARVLRHLATTGKVDWNAA